MGSPCGGRTQFSSDDLKKDLMSSGLVGKLVKHELLPELFRGGRGLAVCSILWKPPLALSLAPQGVTTLRIPLKSLLSQHASFLCPRA